MSGDIAKLVRIIIDFTSSNAASLETPQDKQNMETAKSIFSYLRKEDGTTYLDSLLIKLSQAEFDFTEQINMILG